jgi:WD40 repeat protein
MSAPESRDYGLLEQLAEEFAERHRRGERPTVEEYVERYPALADDLREILPAMVELEKVQKVIVAAPAQPPADEQRMFGDFRILREIGRGGMGVVYEAEQLSLGRRVALKVLTQKMLTDTKQKRRFEREARAAARLHHTNIVPVFGFGDADGTPFYVMQFIQGLGLEKVIKELSGLADANLPTAGFPPPDASMRDVSAVSVAVSLLTGQFVPAENAEEQGERTVTAAGSAGSAPSDPSAPSEGSSSSASSSVSLPGRAPGTDQKVTYWQSVARVGAQVADALEYAHKQGIIHRDIKPSNLLLDLTGTVWVADFGLAKADDQQDLTHTGDILGTLRYMPPEAFVGRVDARGDVYALGLTLYELIALRPAFEERDRHKLIGLVTSSAPAALRTLRPDVPRDLETIVQKAIDRDPARRYASAGELAADLRRFIADEPIRARRQTAAEAALRWARRHPGTALLTAVIVFLMVGVTIASVVVAGSVVALKDRAEETAKREAAERQKAEAQEKETERMRHEADAQRRATEVQVARQYGETGTRLAADGDVAGGLLWNVEALKLEAVKSDPELADLIRTRLGMLLRQTPVPVHAWFFDKPISSFVVDPTGRTVAVTSEVGKVFLHDLETGAQIGPLPFEGYTHTIEFNRDGTRLVVFSSSTSASAPGTRPAGARSLRVWRVRDGQPLTDPVPCGPFASLAASQAGLGTIGPVGRVQESHHADHRYFCLDDTRIVVCAGEKCALHDAATGKEAEEIMREPGGAVEVTEVSPDGKRILLWVAEPRTGADKLRVVVPYVVDVSDPSGPVWRSITVPPDPSGGRAPVSKVQFSPDGRYVLATGSTGLRVFVGEGKEFVSHAFVGGSGDGFGFGPSRTTLFPPEGRQLLVHDTTYPRGYPFQARTTTLALDLVTGKKVDLPRTITSVYQFGPDGRQFLAKSNDRLGVFEAATGAQVSVLPSDLVFQSARLSPDGTHVLVLGGDSAVRVYSAGTGQRAVPWFGHESPVTRAEFTPDGSRVVTATGLSLRVWPLARRERVVRTGKENAAFLTPDGRRLATLAVTGSNRAEVRVWDAATGTPISESVSFEFIGQRVAGGIFALGSFDPTGNWLYVRTLSLGGTSWVFDLTSNKVHPLPVEPGIAQGSPWFANSETTWAPAPGDVGPALLQVTNPISFSTGPDAKVEPPRPPSRLRVLGPTGIDLVPAVSFPRRLQAVWSPDGRAVLTATPDGKVWRCTLWKLRPGGRVEKLELPAVARPAMATAVENDDAYMDQAQVGFSASANRVFLSLRESATGSTGGALAVRVWDTGTGAQVGNPVRVAVASFGDRPQLGPDGEDLFVLDVQQQNQGVRVINVASGRERAMLVPPDRVTGYAVSPDGQRVLTRSATSIQLWDVATGTLRTTLGHEIGLTSANFSADGRRVIARTLSAGERASDGPVELGVGSSSGSNIRVWDVPSAQPLLLGLDGTSPQHRALGGIDGLNGKELQHDRNGTRVIQPSASGEIIIHDLIPDPRPAAELQLLAETLASRRVGGGGLVVLRSDDLTTGWARSAAARVGGWGGAVVGKEWHAERIGALADRIPGLGRNVYFGVLTSNAVGVDSAGLRWHLERYFGTQPAVDPADRGRRLLRARVIATRATTDREWLQVLADLGAGPDPPANEDGSQLRGTALAELGRWPEARAAFRGYAERQQESDKIVPRSFYRAFFCPVTALIELRLRDHDALRQILADAEAGLDEAEKSRLGLGGVYDQCLWPALLLDAPPPKRLVARFGPGAAPRNTPGGRLPTPLNLEAAVAYRLGETAKVVLLLERKFHTDAGCTVPECFFLAMAAKKTPGQEALAEKALSRGIDQMNTESAEASDDVEMLSLSAFFADARWQKRIVNDVLRAEAEHVVRGKKP